MHGFRYTREEKRIAVMNRTLFFVFSFIYLLLYQTDIERMAQPVFASGVDIAFHPLLLSLIFSSVVTAVEYPVSRLLGFKGAWDACNYLPSALLLGANTAYNTRHIMGMSWLAWLLVIFVAMVFLVVMKMISSVSRQYRDNRYKATAIDLGLMTLVLISTMLTGNSDERVHRELMAQRYLEQGRYEKVLRIGRGAEEVTPLLSLCRANAMALLTVEDGPDGSALGDKLFLYPQPYADAVARALAEPDTTGAVMENRNLAALLLQKDLEGFAESLYAPYDTCQVTLSSWKDGSFPVFYMQALLINDSINGHAEEYLSSLYPGQYSAESERLAGYEALKEELSDRPEQYLKNVMYDNYRETYWWYYDYQEGSSGNPFIF